MQMHMEQSLKQTVRPQMIQSAQVLQLNTVELQQYLTELSLENPLMEFIAPSAPYEHKQEAPRRTDEQNRIYERQEQENARDPWNTIHTGSETLSDALTAQLNAMALDPMRRKILSHMIHNLEPTGYLCVPVQDIRNAFGCTEETMQELLALLHSMEPLGVGARNLSERLCIQLQHLYPEEKTALIIAREELELLGKNPLPALAKKLRKSLDEIRSACDLIRSLNPRPGTAYSDGSQMQYIYPELLVFQDGDKGQVVLNEHHIPSIKVNDYYLQMLSSCDSEETVAYINQKKEQLEWIRQCIDQRNQTLLALGDLIYHTQQEFFRNGPGHLKVFTQAEAAKALNVHESTVSRAVRDKHLQCIWGTFPLRYFFPQGMQKRDLICNRIQQLIAREDKYRPLSDQALSEILTREDLAISKRMVSKYRSEMRIPDASSRRKY